MDTHSVHIIRRYSNAKMLEYLRTWRGWRLLGEAIKIQSFNFSGFFWALIADLFSYLIEVLATSGRLIIRRKPGKHAFGSYLYLHTLIFFIAINNQSFSTFIDTFKGLSFLFWKLFSGMDMTWQTIFSLIWQPSGSALGYYILLFGLAGISTILLRLFADWVDDESPNRKGRSVLIRVIQLRTNRISTEFIETYMEPSIFCLSGWAILEFGNDTRLGIALIAVGLSIFYQEFRDSSYRNTF